MPSETEKLILLIKSINNNLLTNNVIDKLSSSDKISLDFIKNTDLNWNWKLISCNSSISWEDIKSNPQLPWDSNFISMNPSITWEIIQNNKSYNWNSRYVSSNPNISYNIVSHNPDYDWDYTIILNRFVFQ